MTRRATLIAAYGLSLLVPTGVALPAQDVDVRAYLDNHEIGVGQQFILNVEVSGTQQIDGEPELPDLTAFAIYRGSGTTSSMQMVNGRTSVSLIIQYRYLATEKGTFEIPPITVRTAGQSLTTEPLSLTVSDTPPPAAGSRPGGDPQIGPEDLFVEADVTGVRVWENQPVIVEYRLFTAVSVSSYNVVRLPATTGFWVEQYDLGDPRVEEIVRNGENYATVLIRKVALFPTGAGTRTIEPLTIEAQVRVRRARDPFESILGRDPLFGRDSLFASIVPVVAATEPIEVEVRPLPAEGRPANFTGFVGQLSLDAELDRDTASVNDAVTLRVEMSGVGNLRGLPEPAIDLPPGFEVFPPEIRDEIALGARGATGSRTFEYVLIPRAPGAQTIPSIHVSYFDPDTEQYRVATATALTLEVTGEATPTAPGDVPRRAGVDQLRTDIRFIHLDTPRFRRIGASPIGHPALWVLIALPLLAIGASLAVRRHRDRLESDVAWARRRRAARVARKRLARARELADGDDARAFYAEAGRALQGFLADQLNISAASMIREEVRRLLLRREVSESSITEAFACLDECDRQRFAPPLHDAAERKAFLARLDSAIATIGEELR